MKEYLYSAFKEAENKIPQLKEIPISFDFPKSIEHGDLSSNAAMLLTKILKKNPRVIAQEIIDLLNLDSSVITKTEIAGPGFINFFFTSEYTSKIIKDILTESDKKYKPVYLEVDKVNPAFNLYKRLGFEISSEDEIRFTMKYLNRNS